MADIQLTAASRNTLLQLNQTQSLTERTQGRLSSGLRVASVIDDPVSFFQARGLKDRASDFSEKKRGIDQGVSTLKAAMNAAESIDSLLKQMKGVLQSAKSQTTTERESSMTQLKELGKQIFQLVGDASYQGTNLLKATTNQLKVEFSEKSTAYLQVDGVALAATTTNENALFTAGVGFKDDGTFEATLVMTSLSGGISDIGTEVSRLDTAVTVLDTAISKLRSTTQKLGTNVAILQTRLDFSKNYVNTLEEGAGKLTLADLNEEGANLVALQTRQSLGIQSLSSAGQQQQAILQLLR